MSGPSYGLPVDLSSPEISPVLSTLGSARVAGRGGLAGVSFSPKSIRSCCCWFDSAGLGSTGADSVGAVSFAAALGGMAIKLLAF